LASATEETRRRRRSSSNAKPGCKRDLSAMAIKRHHLSTQHATSFETPNNRKRQIYTIKKTTNLETSPAMKEARATTRS